LTDNIVGLIFLMALLERARGSSDVYR